MNGRSRDKATRNRPRIPFMLFAGLIGSAILVLMGYIVGLDPTITWFSAVVSFVAVEAAVIYVVTARKQVTPRELVRWGAIFVISGMIMSVLFFAIRGAFAS